MKLNYTYPTLGMLILSQNLILKPYLWNGYDQFSLKFSLATCFFYSTILNAETFLKLWEKYAVKKAIYNGYT